MHGFDSPKRSLYTPVDAAPPTKLSYLKLCTLTICFLGVQFGWAIQIAFTTPIFLELGVAHFWVSFIWLAGPISGFVVQPVVGAVSDSLRSRFGRRRPFILGGAIFIIVGLALISNAQIIGDWMGDKHGHHDRAIILAVIGFWILDLSNNTVQGPCRALLVDVAPPDQQGLGSSIFSFMLGVGNLLGYFIGHLLTTDLRLLFTISMGILAVCISITVFTTTEPPFVAEGPIENPFKKIFVGLVKMPPVVVRVCIVQFFAWVGWFTYIVYITDWMGEEVFRGDPKAPDHSAAKDAYDAGVKQGALALTYNAAVTMVFSAIIPYLLHLVGVKIVYFLGNVVLGLCLISTLFIKSSILATTCIALCGIPWSVTMVLPFTIIGQGVEASDSGLYMGALNIFVVLPQIIVSVTIGFVIKWFHHNIASALVVGGISALIAAVFVFRLIVVKPPAVDVTQESSMRYQATATTPINEKRF